MKIYLLELHTDEKTFNLEFEVSDPAAIHDEVLEILNSEGNIVTFPLGDGILALHKDAIIGWKITRKAEGFH